MYIYNFFFRKNELDLTSNRKKGPGQLEFKAYEKIKVCNIKHILTLI